MQNYCKIEIPELIKISSIISLFRITKDPSNIIKSGESHPFHEFVYVEKGDVNILVDENVFSLQPGSLIIYKPHSFHAIASSQYAVLNVFAFETNSVLMSDFSEIVIEIDKTQQKKLRHILEIGESTFSFAPKDKYWGGHIMNSSANIRNLQKIGNLLELFLLELYEKGKLLRADSNKASPNFRTEQSEQFYSLIKFLKRHVSEKLTLKEISSSCSLSIPGLHRLCKKECGCSPIELFISIKLSEAKRLIAQSSLNFSEISDLLGFSSVHYFSKLFKQKTGMTPSAYMKSIIK